jgi:uncharacterized cupredoxin-like copper-binding protein
MSMVRTIVALLAALASQAAIAGAPRTVDIGMFDSMRFSPGVLTVARGETIRFIVRNVGKLRHEIVIGTPEEIAHHRHAMLNDPGMAHASPNMAHVAPGKREQMTWRFGIPGQLEFACLLPGHYEAGMRGTITVLATP